MFILIIFSLFLVIKSESYETETLACFSDYLDELENVKIKANRHFVATQNYWNETAYVDGTEKIIGTVRKIYLS
jgi:hypothetical protein